MLAVIVLVLAPAAAAGTMSTIITTDYTTSTANTEIYSTDVTSTISSWTSLSSSIAAAAGKAATLLLSMPFDMGTGFKDINISAAHTNITVVGNGVTFSTPARCNSFGRPDCDRFFTVGKDAELVMSNVVLENGQITGESGPPPECGNFYCGGAIFISTGGTATLSDCSFSGNTVGYLGQGGAIFVAGAATLVSCSFSVNYAEGSGGAVFVGKSGIIKMSSCSFTGNTCKTEFGAGGAISVSADGTITLSSCSFSGNSAGTQGGEFSRLGGALSFGLNSTGLLKNCSLLGTVSPGFNDIARDDSANVTFACVDGEVGTPVQMNGTEITVIPPKELQCSAPEYICINGGSSSAKCVLGVPGLSLEKCQQACLP
jgi:predicted outer membrane repeat protein